MRCCTPLLRGKWENCLCRSVQFQLRQQWEQENIWRKVFLGSQTDLQCSNLEHLGIVGQRSNKGWEVHFLRHKPRSELETIFWDELLRGCFPNALVVNLQSQHIYNSNKFLSRKRPELDRRSLRFLYICKNHRSKHSLFHLSVEVSNLALWLAGVWDGGVS